MSRRRLRPRCDTLEVRGLLTTFVVQNTNDGGAGSLRQAILDANANPGTDSIDFRIPASTSTLRDVPVAGFDPQTQTWTITPSTPLPALSEAVTLDGYSQAHAPLPFRYPSTLAQVIALTGGPTGGSFTLTTSSPLPVITTDPIPWDANAAQVLAALTDKLGAGNVFVSGGPAFPDTTITVSFIGAYADLSVPPLIPNNSLTGGTNPSVTVTKVANGDPKFITSAPNTVAAKDGNDAHVRIILDGVLAGGTGITIAAPNVNVRGLAIDRFNIGVEVMPVAQGARIQGNFIGGYFVYPVDPATGDPLQSPADVAFVGSGNALQGVILGSTNTALGGVAPAENNVITLSGSQGVWIKPNAPGNQVFGNQIGVAGPSINGRYAQVGNGAEGILVESSSNAIGSAGGAGNIISANLSHGVYILGASAIRNRVENNFIGAPPGGDYVFGTGDPGNRGDGVRIEGASDNRVGGSSDSLRNVIVGNGVSNPIADPNKPGDGVRITGNGATRNVVLGNFIGLTAGGTSVLGNALEGVIIDGPSNTVGPKNVISGNLRGLALSGANAIKNLIVNNFIGTDAGGTADLGNAHEGVLIAGASNTTVRGDAAGSQVISGNDVGVRLTGAGATSNLIAGNFIGTDATGTQDLGNSQQGVLIEGAPSNTVGGTAATAKNVISANHWGVVITGAAATGNVLQGNNIGTTADGTGRASNEIDGVLIQTGASGNAIGGTAAGAANVIAFNANDGVRIEGNSNRNAILSNSIFQNGALGIDLVDPGSNNQQPAPVLTSITSTAATAQISGTLQSLPNTDYRVQIFATPGLNTAGNAEGKQLIAQTIVTTDATGFANFTATSSQPFPSGQLATATATQETLGNTSRFSAPIIEGVGALSFSVASFTVQEDAGLALITVVRGNGAAGQVSVAYATANGTGIAGVDYLPANGVLTFDPGVTTQTFTVPILINGGSSADKTVNLALSNPSGGASLAPPSTAVLTIISTQGPGLLSFSSSAYFVPEMDVAQITVTRTSGNSGTVTVNYATANGTGVAGVDYLPTSGTLTFGPGVLVRTFTVSTLANPQSTTSKTVNLTLNSPAGGAGLGAPSTAVLTITNTAIPDNSFFVTNTNDAGPGSLRQAITNANNSPGSTIQFHIGPFDPNYNATHWTINLATALSPIVRPTTIDGFSQLINFLPPGASEVQGLLAQSELNGGTFQLSFTNPLTGVSDTTGNIPYNASAAAIQTALEGLLSIGVGNVTVAGGPLPVQALSITYQGTLASLDVPLLVVRGENLQPKASISVTTLNETQLGGRPNSSATSDNAIHAIVVAGASGSGSGFQVSASNTTISGLVIQGFDTGVQIDAGARGVSVVGNLIRQNGAGVVVNGSNNRIGGSAPAARNVIVENGTGLVINGAQATGNRVEGNIVGGSYTDEFSTDSATVAAGNTFDGIIVLSSSNVIGGIVTGAANVISNNGAAGVHVSGTAATRNLVQANFIGTNNDGTSIRQFNGSTFLGFSGNATDGVFIDAGASQNQVGGTAKEARNVIGGNLGAGVHLLGSDTSRNLVAGNSIGVNGDKLPNGHGVWIENSPLNTVGGTTAGARNIIASNAMDGVRISEASASGNVVAGNDIGTVLGADDFGNTDAGVAIEGAPNNVIGGTVDGARNVISGNDTGIRIAGAGAFGNRVQGNYVGVTSDGAADLNNARAGLLLLDAPRNTVGGTATGARNVISSNHWGVLIQGPGATANAVQGNFIGTDNTGTAPLGNEIDGVLIQAGASGNQIGGTATGAANVIAFNAINGVSIEDNSVQNSILNNSIFQDGVLGIDLVGPQANNNQQPPTLTTIVSAPNGTTIGGTLTSAANRTYTIQFFANDGPNASGNVEGQRFLGQMTTTTDSSGQASFSAFVSSLVAQGQIVTATATDPLGNTSEFSPGLTELAGSLSFASATFSVLEDGGFATITVVRTGGAAGDVSVAYATANGTGIAGVDYVATSGTLNFAPGVTEQSFQIQILVNPQSSADKTVLLALSDPAGGASLTSPSNATLTIVNTQGPGVFAFSSSMYVVSEDAGLASITVVRAEGSATVATVVFSTADGTGVAGVDYLPVTQTLIFDIGVTAQTVRVPVLFNTQSQADHTVLLSITNPTGSASLGTPSNATLVINNVPSPGVVDVRPVPGPRGTSQVVIAFDSPLVSDRAIDPRNYGFSLRTAGRDHRINTRDDVLVGIKKIVYDPATWSVTLTTVKPIPGGRKILVVINGATDNPNANVGVANLQGYLLDGNNDGRPGGVFRQVILATQTPRGPQALRARRSRA